MRVQTFAAPSMLLSGDARGRAVVVIDALRMTSVAVAAVTAGCAGILAVGEVSDARRVAAREGALLGGERGARPIEGFDLSNSPLEYTRTRVQGRKIVITTTNGTRAIAAAAPADVLLLGAFINATAVARAVCARREVAFLCAGTAGRFTLEDILAAGCMIARLAEHARPLDLDDQSLAALRLYRQAGGDLADALRGTAHLKRLLDYGLRDDVDYCLTEDSHSVVPHRGEDGWFA